MYVPVKTSEAEPFIELGAKVYFAGQELEVTEVDGRYFTVEDSSRRRSYLLDFEYEKAVIGVPSELVMAELQARGELLNIKQGLLDGAEQEVDELIDLLSELLTVTPDGEASEAYHKAQAIIESHREQSSVAA